MNRVSNISKLKAAIQRLSFSQAYSKMKLFLERKRNVSLTVYFLFIAFGLVSWTAANGILSESPALTAILPECQRLTSYIVIIVQSANIGPLVYLLIRGIVKLTCKRTYILDISAIYLILVLALITGILLILFWSHLTAINGVEVSLAFFMLTGLLSISDCTSTVLFLPFVGLYPNPYISALYIGEGLSGVIPSIWALIQGSPTSKCLRHGTEIPGIRFSPTYYLIVIPLITTISLIAFTLILFLPSARRERHNTEELNPQIKVETNNDLDSSDSQTLINNSDTNNKTDLIYRAWNLVQYVFIQIILCFFANSFLYSLASFFTLPYGSATFLWALNLTLIAVPIGSLLGGLVTPQIKTLWCLFACFLLISTWLTFLAIWNGSHPLKPTTIGSIHVVLLLTLIGLIAGYVKVGVGIQAKNKGGTAFLFYIAIGTQVGSFFGGLTSFIIVNYSSIYINEVW